MVCLYDDYEAQRSRLRESILEGDENNVLMFCQVDMYYTFFAVLPSKALLTNNIYFPSLTSCDYVKKNNIDKNLLFV